MGSEVRVCTVAQTHDHHLCPVRAKVSCPVSSSLHCEPQSPSLENQSRSEQPLNQETRLPSVKTGARSSSLLLSHLLNVALFLQPSLSQSTLCILSTSCVTMWSHSLIWTLSPYLIVQGGCSGRLWRLQLKFGNHCFSHFTVWSTNTPTESVKITRNRDNCGFYSPSGRSEEKPC